ncbi:MAG: peptidyl-prolyl cis-trans isomerase [Planctomycetes bacterium]|nr:peptidyl-prolyl cis-trans isomerase [Planctomycetota bacterium]
MIGKPKSPVETLLPLVVVLTLAASLDVSSYGLWAQQAPPKLFRPDAQKPKISDPKAVAIIDKYLEAVGGKAMLEKIKDKSTAYTNTLFQPTGEAKAEIELMMKGHYNLREQWKLNYEIQEGQPLSFVQIYNGDTEEAWVAVMGRVDELQGKTLHVFVYGKHMDNFFCHWKADGYVLTLAGEAEVDMGDRSEPCDIVLVTDFSGRQSERYFFSRSSGLLLKKEWRDVTRNPRKPVNREQYYKRYKSIPFMDDSGNSIKFAMLLEILGDGDLDTERRYTTVQFNSGLSSKLFEKPEGEPGPVVDGSNRPKNVAKKPAAKKEGSARKRPEGSAPKRRPGQVAKPSPAAPASPSTPASPPPTRVGAAHILISYAGSMRSKQSRTKDEARKLAEQIVAEAKAEGADFAELAKKYSDGPSGPRGGALGVFGRGQMVGPFETAAFALPVDGVSAVVETRFGFHVIKRTE